jgi:predicted transcriptional regulator
VRLICAREIKRAKKLDDREIANAMKVLVDARWVVDQDNSRKGATSWTLNPKVHAAFASYAKREAENQEAVRRKIAESRKLITRHHRGAE